MKLESVLLSETTLPSASIPEAKKLALLVQAAFIDERDWCLTLEHKDGFICGFLKQSEAGKVTDVLVFADAHSLYLVDDPSMLEYPGSSIPALMSAHPNMWYMFHGLGAPRSATANHYDSIKSFVYDEFVAS